MFQNPFKSTYQFSTIIKALNTQNDFLNLQTKNVISKLNEISDDYNTICTKHTPIAFLFHNPSEHNEFEISLKIITKTLEFSPLYKYDIDLNDGDNYGLDTYKTSISKYPTEDYFSVIRSEYLNKILFEFFLECFWNSKLSKQNSKFLFSDTTDFSTLISLKDGLSEYYDLNQLL
jgi:hypothetical protein